MSKQKIKIFHSSMTDNIAADIYDLAVCKDGRVCVKLSKERTTFEKFKKSVKKYR